MFPSVTSSRCRTEYEPQLGSVNGPLEQPVSPGLLFTKEF